MPLTNEQIAFTTQQGSAFLHACPGAGKTHAIIGRLTQLLPTVQPRQGIAVLSFTNSAVEKFRQRCAGASLSSFLEHPSFVGTFDSFVRKFIVLPACSATSRSRPTIIDSWDTLGIEIRLLGRNAFRGDGVSLDAFDPETNRLLPERILVSALRLHAEAHRDLYERVATQTRVRLMRAGYLSSEDARAVARRSIHDEALGRSIGSILTARFYEVIVDEGQDCNPVELGILSWLRSHGARVFFVCDPDQSIYDFRDGNPGRLREFQATYPENARLPLTGNFRSSSCICRLSSTLRANPQPDNALGEFADIAHEVPVMIYTGQSPTPAIGEAFVTQIAGANLDKSNSIILAHSRNTARRAAGGGADAASAGNSRVAAIAAAVRELKANDASARSREHALQAVETALLDLMGLKEDGEHLFQAMERGGIERREHRRRALHLLMKLPHLCRDSDEDRTAWVATLRAAVDELRIVFPRGVTARSYFPEPPNGRWSELLAQRESLRIKSGTIHEAKGHEYHAVCVVIPPNRAPRNHTEALVQSWEQRVDSEAKRVFYVGVTRAQQLCALAIPAAIADRCLAVLAHARVPHRRLDL